MYIPDLVKSKRSREYYSYGETQRAKVVYAYLFKGMTHRQIDAEVLDLDEVYSHGFQSMGILHHIGLVAAHKGLFEGMAVDMAINKLQTAGNKYDEVIEMLEQI